MKYRIIEQTDGLGDTVYIAQVEDKGLFGRAKWADIKEFVPGGHGLSRTRHFLDRGAATDFLLKHFAPKVNNIVAEGEL